ncbi:hypothetical protein Glaag_4582 (plasmid) [Glaciecola sp. 4H-3-7+YE-5]|nr:hypothetical protein Glaag_4582 [Glaciecola sp. 4H-3-7+YE-5]
MFGRFFKTVSVVNFSLGSNETVEASELAENVKILAHTPIKPSQKESVGFTSIISYHDPELLIHTVDRFIFLTVTYEFKKVNQLKVERLLSAKKKEVAKKNNIDVDELADQEIEEIRERIKTDELQKASPTEDVCNIIIDSDTARVYFSVMATTVIAKKAVGLLQKCYPSLKVHPFAPQTVEASLTQWVYQPSDKLPDRFSLGNKIALKSESDSRAKLQKQDLGSMEVTTMIDHGKLVHEVATVYQDRVGFVLTNQCFLRKATPLDLYYDGVDYEGINPDSYIDTYTRDWIMLCSWLTDFYEWLTITLQIPKIEYS